MRAQQSQFLPNKYAKNPHHARLGARTACAPRTAWAAGRRARDRRGRLPPGCRARTGSCPEPAGSRRCWAGCCSTVMRVGPLPRRGPARCTRAARWTGRRQRATRAKTGMLKMPMAMMALPAPGPKMAVIMIAESRAGKAQDQIVEAHQRLVDPAAGGPPPSSRAARRWQCRYPPPRQQRRSSCARRP